MFLRKAPSNVPQTIAERRRSVCAACLNNWQLLTLLLLDDLEWRLAAVIFPKARGSHGLSSQPMTSNARSWEVSHWWWWRRRYRLDVVLNFALVAVCALTWTRMVVQPRETFAAYANGIVELLAGQGRRIFRTVSTEYFTAASAI